MAHRLIHDRVRDGTCRCSQRYPTSGSLLARVLFLVLALVLVQVLACVAWSCSAIVTARAVDTVIIGGLFPCLVRSQGVGGRIVDRLWRKNNARIPKESLDMQPICGMVIGSGHRTAGDGAAPTGAGERYGDQDE